MRELGPDLALRNFSASNHHQDHEGADFHAGFFRSA